MCDLQGTGALPVPSVVTSAPSDYSSVSRRIIVDHGVFAKEVALGKYACETKNLRSLQHILYYRYRNIATINDRQ